MAEKNLDQSSLSRDLDVDKSVVSRLLRPELPRLGLDTFIALRRRLHLKLDDIVDRPPHSVWFERGSEERYRGRPAEAERRAPPRGPAHPDPQ